MDSPPISLEGVFNVALAVSRMSAGRRKDDAPYAKFARAFQPGDLVYGLAHPRRGALVALVNLGYHGVDTSIGFGEFHKTPRPVYAQNTLTNVVWDRASPERYASEVMIAERLEDVRRGVDFRDFLARHARYDVAHQPGSGQHGLGWRRTSKAGLEFQIRRGRRVHFVVDLVVDTLAAVARKDEGHGQGVTASELRWLYRHRRMPAVQGLVRFWTEGGPVDQARVFDHPAWAAYTPTQVYETGWDKPPT